MIGRITDYAHGFKFLRRLGGDLPIPVLLLRILAWKAYRATRSRPVIRIHARSRMRLEAKPHESGVRAGIYLFRDKYEPSVRDAIDRFLARGDTCYDIGANIGLWSLRMAEKVGGDGRVYSFEPLIENLRCLKANAKLSGHSNIRLMSYALGAETGTATIYAPEDTGRAALAPETEVDRAQAVEIRRLDDVWDEQGQPLISFVKMDVEGAEALVLRGGERFFRTIKPVVCCELNPAKLRNMGFVPADLGCLVEWGYRAYEWDESEHALLPIHDFIESEGTRDLVFLAGQNVGQRPP